MQVNAKPRTQWGGKQTTARGGTDERKGVEVYLYRPRRRAFIYHDVYAIVFHSRVKILFNHGRKAVYLVDKEHVVGF